MNLDRNWQITAHMQIKGATLFAFEKDIKNDINGRWHHGRDRHDGVQRERQCGKCKRINCTDKNDHLVFMASCDQVTIQSENGWNLNATLVIFHLTYEMRKNTHLREIYEILCYFLNEWTLCCEIPCIFGVDFLRTSFISIIIKRYLYNISYSHLIVASYNYDACANAIKICEN